jgi:DNA adenine methylase
LISAEWEYNLAKITFRIESKLVNQHVKNGRVNPLVKWPGGKRALLPQLLPVLGIVTGRYFEPFLGGAALYLSLTPSRSFLSDSNPDLINLYTQVRDNPETLIQRLGQLQNSEEDYYKIRQTHETDPIRSAARFLYLTSLSFNGIYRLNLQGIFNVPYGHKTGKSHFDPEQVRLVSSALTKARIRCSDFESAVKNARRDDTVYFDPPYTVAHGNNGFLKYNEKIFSWGDQVRLAETASKLSAKGCRVFVSNAFHPSIKALYSEFTPLEVTRPSLIAAASKFRGTISEYLFYNSI